MQSREIEILKAVVGRSVMAVFIFSSISGTVNALPLENCSHLLSVKTDSIAPSLDRILSRDFSPKTLIQIALSLPVSDRSLFFRKGELELVREEILRRTRNYMHGFAPDIGVEVFARTQVLEDVALALSMLVLEPLPREFSMPSSHLDEILADRIFADIRDPVQATDENLDSSGQSTAQLQSRWLKFLAARAEHFYLKSSGKIDWRPQSQEPTGHSLDKLIKFIVFRNTVPPIQWRNLQNLPERLLPLIDTFTIWAIDNINQSSSELADLSRLQWSEMSGLEKTSWALLQARNELLNDKILSASGKTRVHAFLDGRIFTVFPTTLSVLGAATNMTMVSAKQWTAIIRRILIIRATKIVEKFRDSAVLNKDPMQAVQLDTALQEAMQRLHAYDRNASLLP